MGGSLSLGTNSGKVSQIHGLKGLKRIIRCLSSLETRGEYDPLYFDYPDQIVHTSQTTDGLLTFWAIFLSTTLNSNRQIVKHLFGTASGCKAQFKSVFSMVKRKTSLKLISALFLSITSEIALQPFLSCFPDFLLMNL